PHQGIISPVCLSRMGLFHCAYFSPVLSLGPQVISPSDIPPSAPSQNSYLPLEPLPNSVCDSGNTVNPAETMLVEPTVNSSVSFLAFLVVIKIAPSLPLEP